MEFISDKSYILKINSKTLLNMVMEQYFIITEDHMKVSFKMISKVEGDSNFTQMVHFIKVAINLE